MDGEVSVSPSLCHLPVVYKPDFQYTLRMRVHPLLFRRQKHECAFRLDVECF